MWLAQVRIARDCGDISSLLPPGVTSLADAPYTIVEAVTAGLNFLSYAELPDDERPPKRIWLDGDKMKRWWDEIKRLREAKARGEDTDRTSRNALLDLLD